MSKQIKQFRFYTERDSRNYPEGLTLLNLVTGEAFGNYMPVTKLSIQTLPGNKFYLNNGLNPIVIGYTGIYELDINDLAEITSIRFDHQSITKVNAISDTYLFVDLIYEKGEE